MIMPGRKRSILNGYHQAYLQVKDWGGNSLNPESSGWHMVDGILEPIPMRQESASQFLFEVKKCWGKSDHLDMF